MCPGAIPAQPHPAGGPEPGAGRPHHRHRHHRPPLRHPEPAAAAAAAEVPGAVPQPGARAPELRVPQAAVQPARHPAVRHRPVRVPRQPRAGGQHPGRARQGDAAPPATAAAAAAVYRAGAAPHHAVAAGEQVPQQPVRGQQQQLGPAGPQPQPAEHRGARHSPGTVTTHFGR